MMVDQRGYMNHDATKENIMKQPSKTQMILGICLVWSVFNVCQWVPKLPTFGHADNEEFEQSRGMPGLNGVFDQFIIQICLYNMHQFLKAVKMAIFR